jgi:fibronectin-binding autotransporter adhesin
VNAGRLIFDSQTKGLTSSFGDLVVNAGATLAVTGLVNHIQVNLGGTLAPGLFSGVGALLPQRGLSFAPGATLAVDLQGVSPSLDFDTIFVNGAVNLSNATLQVALGYDGVLDSEYQIVSSGFPVLGTFAGLPEGATFLATNGVFQITYTGGDGHDIVLTLVSPPPSIQSFVSLPDGTKQITGTGEPGWFALFEATENLAPPISWELLDVQIPDSSGLVTFRDTDATNYPARFYRITAP